MTMKRARWTTWLKVARGTRGAEIAETAMILPLLFMIVMAIFWFGQAFRIYGTITQAARQGARAAVAPVCATCATVTSPTQNAINAVNSTLTAASLNTAQVQAPVPIPLLCSCQSQNPSCSTSGQVACDTSVSSSNVCVQLNVQLSNTSQGGSATCGTSVSFGYKNSFHFTIPFTGLDLGNIALPAQAQMRAETQ